MSTRLRPNEEIVRAIKGCADLEVLLNLSAGVILGKNQRRYLHDSEEHDQFAMEILDILMAISLRVIELAPPKQEG